MRIEMKKLLIAILVVCLGTAAFFKEASTAPSGANNGAVNKRTAALATSLVLRTTCNQNCVLTSFEVSQDGALPAAPWAILIYDATVAPVDGAVTPAKCYMLPSGTLSFTAAFNTPPIFLNGIVIVVSTATTCFTQTSAGAHLFISGDVQ